MDYDDFLMTIDHVGANRYRVATQSSAGQHEYEFGRPVNDKDLRILLLTVGRSRERSEHLNSLDMTAVRTFGGKLYRCAFGGAISGAFQSARQTALLEDKGLRIRLRLTGAPKLSCLPWEYLYDGTSFLALSTFSPVIRYVDVAAPVRDLPVEVPVNILAIVSSPSDSVHIDSAREIEKMSKALEPLVRNNFVRLNFLDRATLSNLQQELRRSTYHVIHYIGHSIFDEAAGHGALLFLRDESDLSAPIDGFRLATILSDHRSLRLVVLNSCEGARSTIQDPFASLAVDLIRREMPVVVAMQFDITDEAAITFCENFYAALADEYTVDAAVTEARKAIFSLGNDLEWGTPTLFSRVSDTNLFRSRVSAKAVIQNTIEAKEPQLPEQCSHQVLATSRTPALVIYLIDASASMAERLSNGTKAEAITGALEKIFIRMIRRSTKGEVLSPRYRISMLVYSEVLTDILGGIRSIDEVARKGSPVINPSGPTNTAGAFMAVERLLQEEVPHIQDCPAPLVVHITDGQYTGADPSPIAKRIMDMTVHDGHVLVANIFLADNVLTRPISEIGSWRGVRSTDDLNDEYAKVLFDMSSVIPGSYRSSMVEFGYDIAPNARMLFPGLYSDLIELGFALSGATPTA